MQLFLKIKKTGNGQDKDHHIIAVIQKKLQKL